MLNLKASTRMRREGFGAHVVQLSMLYGDGTWFRKHCRVEAPAYTVADVFRNGLLLFNCQRGGDGKYNARRQQGDGRPLRPSGGRLRPG